jgi:potassium-transporting ATPase KdpC subunit
MRKHFINAVLMTAVTTILLGIVYPLAITALAQLFFPDKANGQIIYRDRQPIGSRIIGQPFTGPQYFHSRPSAAGSGYDATQSGGSNLAPTNAKLLQRVAAQVQTEQQDGKLVPVDLVTTSASGLDPDISPAAADYQVVRIAKSRGVLEQSLRDLVTRDKHGRQLGFFGEDRVNVLELNLALDNLYPRSSTR